ncbi:class I SAM-dependent methyltransferase [Patulibacter sp. NPDC049589]|uniref:class I SAM-dependent methyltransferase n=1 Tax=Patulibacter sp. NPDC049589 TaxID=3154731 RepID=UPI0034264385
MPATPSPDATGPAPAATAAPDAPAPDVCPACGGVLRAWRTVPTSDASLPGVFALRRCATCGTAVTAGEPPTFDDAHDGGSYATRRPRGSGLAAPLLHAFDRQRLRLLARHGGRSGRLVDAGAGRGRFVAAARDAGWDAGGLEPAARGVEAARDVYGVTLDRAGIEDAAVPPGSADAVTLWHVLEHVADPRDTLATLRDWLRPGGLLLVGVPNVTALQARIGGDRWFHLDVPRHRTHFSPEGLRRAAEAAGLEVVAFHGVLLEHNPFGMWQSVVNRLSGTTSYLYYLLKRSAPLRARPLAITLLALPLIPLLAVVEFAAGALGLGGTMVLVARRPD